MRRRDGERLGRLTHPVARIAVLLQIPDVGDGGAVGGVAEEDGWILPERISLCWIFWIWEKGMGR